MFPEQIGLGEIAIQYVDKGVIGINRLQHWSTYLQSVLIKYLSIIFLNMFTLLELKQLLHNFYITY